MSNLWFHTSLCFRVEGDAFGARVLWMATCPRLVSVCKTERQSENVGTVLKTRDQNVRDEIMME